MSNTEAQKFPPEVWKLFDKYVHGAISRREFIDRAGAYAVAGMSGAAILDALNPKFAEAQQVAPTDKRVVAEYVEIPAPGYGKLRGYLVKPVSLKGKLPTVLVVHENRGLNPHIEDVARRVALENFIAFAPDALFPLGGYPGDEDKAREQFQKLDQTKTREDFVAAVEYLKKLPQGTGKVAVTGFCYGGGVANFLATRVPDLAAAVPFYGSPPAVEEAGKIKAPLLLQFAETDERINAAWPASEAALKAAGVKYTAYIYPGTQHGFNNDTTPRYNKEAADLAWKRTIDFFKANLRAS
ncbi:dienelactone hydrolase family protein [Steroidobacter sp.]|uniref:dienelactone hydrolase family protein n=1 Tax=Steroidobacter sp. TaxID=1978227 RepID=UPI001A6258F8|nr:dienelactone hydrolase family protein [Steroidobacter sp.]MBL8266686.1 dienelactone hydrolase family protein [Steroidobacter sp.]